MNSKLNVIKKLAIVDVCRDDDTASYEIAAVMHYSGDNISTKFGDDRKNEFYLAIYDFGDGDLQFGDEQTTYYLGNEVVGDYDCLPDDVRSYVETAVKQLMNELA